MKRSRLKRRSAVALFSLVIGFGSLLAVGCAKPRIETRCPFGEMNSEAWSEVAEGRLDGAPETERFLMEVARQCGWIGQEDG